MIKTLAQFYYHQLDNKPKKDAFTQKENGQWISLSSQEFIDKANQFSTGLLKLGIKKEDKIGFANTKGEIIIEPKFKCSNPFYKGLARVTLECSIFQDSEHHSLMQSDKWFYINKKGLIINYE